MGWVDLISSSTIQIVDVMLELGVHWPEGGANLEYASQVVVVVLHAAAAALRGYYYTTALTIRNRTGGMLSSEDSIEMCTK